MLDLPQPCPVCGSLVNGEHIVIGTPRPAGGDLWRSRVRIYCEYCEGVAELWFEARFRPGGEDGAHSVWWRQTGRRRWHARTSRAWREMLAALTRQPDAGVILAAC